MTRFSAVLASGFVSALFLSAPVKADNPVGSFGKLDHVFLIMMENKADATIIGNPYAPFINAYKNIANWGQNYFAVGHPSLPNYLEIVGGSNFGLRGDNWPRWVNTGCIDNAPGSSSCASAFTPIAVAGTDLATAATATATGQCGKSITGAPVPNNCALLDYPAITYAPQSIADQLVAKGLTWKTYQQSLPIAGPTYSIGVNYADGFFSNLSPASVFAAASPIQPLYAVKHNPFAYFANIETGANPSLSFDRVRDFDGASGLWSELQRPTLVANFLLIVPDQCHDMHGASGGTAACTKGLLIMQQGDATLRRIIASIKASPVWPVGRNVIITVWDENDGGNKPNRVLLLVETNYAPNKLKSAASYDHYSLLRTLQAGFGLPCLNHSCDPRSHVMNDLFGGP